MKVTLNGQLIRLCISIEEGYLSYENTVTNCSLEFLGSIKIYKKKVWKSQIGNQKRKSRKERQYNNKKKKNKWSTMIYKTLHRKHKFEQHEAH